MGRLDRIIGTNIINHKDGEIRLGQTWHEMDVLDGMIMRERPAHFVEIGIHEGGLSWLLIPDYPWMKYIGIEIDPNLIRPEVIQLYRENGANLMIGDCFEFVRMTNIGALPKKLIFCDGGNKVRELQEYSKICHTGDLIFVHDYWDGKRKVREIPGSELHPEVHPEDVAFMEGAGFEPYPDGYLNETRIIGWRKL